MKIISAPLLVTSLLTVNSAPDECISTFPFPTWGGGELAERRNAASTNGAFLQNSEIQNSQQAKSPEVRISTSRSSGTEEIKTIPCFCSGSRKLSLHDAHIFILLLCCSQRRTHCAATSQGRPTTLPSQAELAQKHVFAPFSAKVSR